MRPVLSTDGDAGESLQEMDFSFFDQAATEKAVHAVSEITAAWGGDLSNIPPAELQRIRADAVIA